MLSIFIKTFSSGAVGSNGEEQMKMRVWQFNSSSWEEEHTLHAHTFIPGWIRHRPTFLGAEDVWLINQRVFWLLRVSKLRTETLLMFAEVLTFSRFLRNLAGTNLGSDDSPVPGYTPQIQGRTHVSHHKGRRWRCRTVQNGDAASPQNKSPGWTPWRSWGSHSWRSLQCGPPMTRATQDQEETNDLRGKVVMLKVDFH